LIVTYHIVLFIIGLAALFFGGEWLVKGASRIARNLRINPIVIGLTVVAFGTSAPEFIVCLIAALEGSSDIVLGNIIGSNISNIGLILGISALISPLIIHMKLIRFEVPVMIILGLLLYVLAMSLEIGRIGGVVLFVSLLAFTCYSYFSAFREPPEVEEEYKEALPGNNGTPKQLGLIVLGIVALVIGANLVVDSAIVLAKMAGVSELIISITAVAIGTSLPELSTSIVAALKKEHDIIIGNIIGSNIFNLGILGLVSVIRPISVNEGILRFELPAMIVFSLIILPVMRTGHRISRVEGSFLLVLYAVFIAMIFIKL